MALLETLFGATLGAAVVVGSVSQPVPYAPRPLGYTPPVRMVQRWMPSDARCGNAVVPVAQILRPGAALVWGQPKSVAQTYRFRIDATGRPMSIARVTTEWAMGVDDIAPSLAASRFDLTGAQAACEITYTPDLKTLADAPVEDLVSYSMTRQNGPLPREGWARIRPVDGDCVREPRTLWLNAVYPDYAKLPGTPGVRDWSMVGYDLDAKGRPRHVRHVMGTGNAALDQAARAALSRSRLTNGPRHGCLNPYVRKPDRLPAPADVDPETVRPAGATCTRDGDWDRKPVLTYPENFNRRSIEGWALIGFDVAPWGATGNLRVLASEPAQEFGERAMQIVGAATKAKSATGATGCVERVRFVIRDSAAAADSQPAS